MNVIKYILTKLDAYRTSRNYRGLGISASEIKRLRKGKGSYATSLFGNTIRITSFFWYLHGLDELFLDHTYQFNAKTDEPMILDCGANIGLSSIYFKKQYPKARIIAFEADPNIAQVLHDNLNAFNFTDIEVISKAVWTANTTLSFKSDGAVGGHIIEGSLENTIESTRLKDYLSAPIDFLKIDIEGAEYEILRDCRDTLKNVENIFIEYHSFLANEQMLDEILYILKQAGFKYYIKEAWNNQPKPFSNTRNTHYDLQLNIFGYRL